MSVFDRHPDAFSSVRRISIRRLRAASGLLCLAFLLIGPPAMATDTPMVPGKEASPAIAKPESVQSKTPVGKPEGSVMESRSASSISQTGKIVGVTLLPNGAWITRELTVSWSMHGTRTIQVRDLPRDIDQGSVQVQSAAMTLSAPMQWHDLPVEDSEAFQMLDKQIDSLNRQLAKAHDSLLAAHTRLSIFQAQMASAGPERKHGSVTGAFLTDSKARSRFDRLLAQLLDSRRRAQNDVDSVMNRLKRAEQKRTELRQKGPRLMLALPMSLNADQKLPEMPVLLIRYRVKDARWMPIYRADLETPAPNADNGAAASAPSAVTTAPKAKATVQWSLVAQVSQTTGEDWTDVPITLSLLDTRRYYPVPRLDRWTIGFSPAVKPGVQLRADAVRQGAEMAAKSLPFAPSDETGFNAEFRSAAPVTIASNPAATIIPLMHAVLPAQATDLIAPSRSPLAILTARFTLGNAMPLPAGIWQLSLNGAQIGSVHEPALSPTKKMSLGFGVDRRIEVTVDSPADQRDENGLIGKAQQLVRRRVITVQSQHSQPIPVTVLMNLPVAEDTDIAVDPLADNTPPSNKQYDGTDGVWAWSNQIKPGQKVTINFGFRLRWPANKSLYGF